MAEQLPLALGDGLVMRAATVDDAERLVAFNGEVHRPPDQAEPDAFVATWTRDLLTRPHPTVAASDFLIVEDGATGRIASTMNLISQTWSYGGIEVGVGRLELVGTDPAYRRRGLVRRQFEVVHGWSAARGELVQAITGIPNFYRQFGYEMALELGGGRIMPRHAIPKLKPGEPEKVRFREAVAADLPFVNDVARRGLSRYLVSAVRGEALWRLELDGRTPEIGFALVIAERLDGEPIGFLAHLRLRTGNMLPVFAAELRPGVSWLEAGPALFRYLAGRGADAGPFRGDEPFELIGFRLGSVHPLYQVAGERAPGAFPTYAFYLRVADLPSLIRRITPVLERRLAGSVACGYSGELKLSFYRDGVRLAFEGGRLLTAEAFAPDQAMTAGAWFPGLTFLQLLFGYRSLTELRGAFADCYTRGDEAPVLLETLFPRCPSMVWAIA